MLVHVEMREYILFLFSTLSLLSFSLSVHQVQMYSLPPFLSLTHSEGRQQLRDAGSMEQEPRREEFFSLTLCMVLNQMV